jgi:hypothetical protein
VLCSEPSFIEKFVMAVDFLGVEFDAWIDRFSCKQLRPLGEAALCVFLAAVKLADADPENPEPLRLLVLDDVLIGLDLNNRLPLLQLLRDEFPRHQIILPNARPTVV